MKRQFTEEIDQIKKTVKKIHSLIKLPTLNPQHSSLRKLQSHKNQIETLSPPNDHIDWKQRLLNRKLAPISTQIIKAKPQSSFIKEKSPASLRTLEPRVASSKNQLNFLVGIKTKSISHNHMPINETYSQQVVQLNSIIDSVKRSFSYLIGPQLICHLQFPNLISVKIQEFHPYWQMVDTILLTFQQNYFTNTRALKSICMAYTHITAELNQVRQQVYSDVQKYVKKELLTVLVQAFAIEVHFVYSILAVILMKDPTHILAQFLISKVQTLLRIRKLVLQAFLCDPTQKQEITSNNKIVKFLPLKQKILTQTHKILQKILNQSFKTLSQLDDKFRRLQANQVRTLQQVVEYEQKLKKQILRIPTQPYLPNPGEKEYNLIIEVENFMFREDLKFSTLLIREDSIHFLKNLMPHCNLIIYTRMPHQSLKPFLKHLEDHDIHADGVLDKKHLSYSKFTQIKDLSKIGLRNLDTHTIVIDPNYRKTINQDHWHICVPINKDGAWNDSMFLSNLLMRLIKIIENHEQVQMTQFEF